MVAALFTGFAGCGADGSSDESSKLDIRERTQEQTNGVLDAEVKMLKRKGEDVHRIDVWIEEVLIRASAKLGPRDLATMHINQPMGGDPMLWIAMLPAGTRILGSHEAGAFYRRSGFGFWNPCVPMTSGGVALDWRFLEHSA